MANLLIIGGLAIAVLFIMILGSYLIYILFFKKSTVIVFGGNGLPNEVIKARKVKNRLYFSNGSNFLIMNNYIKQGNKFVYFAYKMDDISYLPYNFVKSEESVLSTSKINDNKFDDDYIKNFASNKISKEFKKLIKKISNFESKIDILTIKLYNSKEKKKLSIKTKIESLSKKLDTLKEQHNKLIESEKDKFSKLSETKSECKFSIIKSLEVDSEWSHMLASSFEEGASRFKFGLDKFAPLISVVVVVLLCVIMVLGSVKYVTTLDPVELEVLDKVSKTLESISIHYTEGAKANLAITETLNKNTVSEVPR